jgi:hypothetical protein
MCTTVAVVLEADYDAFSALLPAAGLVGECAVVVKRELSRIYPRGTLVAPRGRPSLPRTAPGDPLLRRLP